MDKSIAYKAGYDAATLGIPLKRSAISNLMEGSKQWEDFLQGYEDFKKGEKLNEQ